MNYLIKRSAYYVKDWVKYPNRSEFIWTIYQDKAMVFTQEQIEKGDLPPLPHDVELIEIA